jgi:subtilisin family serine protease
MSQDSLVAYVEEDSEIDLSTVQSPAVWGLDRVDQRSATLNNSYSYTYNGAGVSVYVIDSGIKTNHVEFGGRAVAVWDSVGDGRNGQDCFGHGTHVAGTIGGRTFGVAKGATLLSVRVYDCYARSQTGAVLAAVNWVTANRRKPAVVNMSLGGPIDYALDNAVTNSVNSGITYVVSAGNAGVDACSVSPARAPGTITVGSTDGYDRRSIFNATESSNYGPCLDVWAPGSTILSAGITSTTATRYDSGTSMAAPHVTGAAALYLSAYPTATPTAVRNAIVGYSTTNRLTGIGTTSPNRLLYSLLRP